jgi:hypothetical protein
MYVCMYEGDITYLSSCPRLRKSEDREWSPTTIELLPSTGTLGLCPGSRKSVIFLTGTAHQGIQNFDAT